MIPVNKVPLVFLYSGIQYSATLIHEAEQAAANAAASLLGGSTARNTIMQRHMARKIANSLSASLLESADASALRASPGSVGSFVGSPADGTPFLLPAVPTTPLAHTAQQSPASAQTGAGGGCVERRGSGAAAAAAASAEGAAWPASPQTPAAATAPATPQPTHTCENRCGFQGSYDAVLAHERTCAAAGASAQDAATRAGSTDTPARDAVAEQGLVTHAPRFLLPSPADPFRPPLPPGGHSARRQPARGAAALQEVFLEEEEGDEEGGGVEGGREEARGQQPASDAAAHHSEATLRGGGAGGRGRDNREEAAEEGIVPGRPSTPRVSGGDTGLEHRSSSLSLSGGPRTPFGRTPSADFAELLNTIRADNRRRSRSPTRSPMSAVAGAGGHAQSAAGEQDARMDARRVGFVEEGEEVAAAAREEAPGVKTVTSHHELLGEGKFQDMLRQLKEAQRLAAQVSGFALNVF